MGRVSVHISGERAAENSGLWAHELCITAALCGGSNVVTWTIGGAVEKGEQCDGTRNQTKNPMFNGDN
jgi:hypothetical protein